MDPLACLKSALEALHNGEPAECIAHLFDYYQWRLKNGFEPVLNGRAGDMVAADLVSQALDFMEPADDQGT